MKVFRVQDNCGLWTVRHYEHLSFSCRLFNYKVETFRFLEGNYDHFFGLEVFIGGPSLFILKSVAEDRVNVFIQCPYCETVVFPIFTSMYISIRDCRYIQLYTKYSWSVYATFWGGKGLLLALYPCRKQELALSHGLSPWKLGIERLYGKIFIDFIGGCRNLCST